MKKAKIGTRVTMLGDDGQPHMMTVIRHGRDAGGIYTEVRQDGNGLYRFHPEHVMQADKRQSLPEA